MQWLSFVRPDGSEGFGAVLPDGGVVDLAARWGGRDLGAALRQWGADHLRDRAARLAADWSLASIIRFRPPVADPARIICVGLNYDEHRRETGRAPTARPTVFLRLASSQVGHQCPLTVPLETHGLDYEGEIAVVMARGGRRIAAEHAHAHLLGFAAYNDASARDWQSHGTQWTPGKNFPATGAFGPWIVDTDKIAENDVLTLTTKLNGRELQRADSTQMIFPIAELVAYVSTFTPLEPGDVLVTGTPGGVGFKREPPVWMRPGDIVEVEVDRVGLLRNPVCAEAPQVS